MPLWVPLFNYKEVGRKEIPPIDTHYEYVRYLCY